MSKSFREDLTGKRFGRLTVLEFVPNDIKDSCWKCMCDCGNISIVRGHFIKNGNTKSCGCLFRELSSVRNTKHGKANTRLYTIYDAMKSRCYNPRNNRYKNYGGRGIKICDEWRNDITAFCKWAVNNGYCDDLTIDRIDVNGDYEPNNCRWVDMKTQQQNRSNNITVGYQDKKQTLTEVAVKLGIRYRTLYDRYHRGDRGERLFRPVKNK